VIHPTPGRVVWYRPKANEVGEAGLTLDGSQPLAALIAFVHSPTEVNLGVLSAHGEFVGRVSVPLVQDRDATEGECEWMPFQKGQAAKAEQLEQKPAEQPKPVEPQSAPLAPEPETSADPAPAVIPDEPKPGEPAPDAPAAQVEQPAPEPELAPPAPAPTPVQEAAPAPAEVEAAPAPAEVAAAPPPSIAVEGDNITLTLSAAEAEHIVTVLEKELHPGAVVAPVVKD
jgi:outer membrane biosynthesis protein TonB